MLLGWWLTLEGSRTVLMAAGGKVVAFLTSLRCLLNHHLVPACLKDPDPKDFPAMLAGRYNVCEEKIEIVF